MYVVKQTNCKLLEHNQYFDNYLGAHFQYTLMAHQWALAHRLIITGYTVYVYIWLICVYISLMCIFGCHTCLYVTATVNLCHQC